MDTGLRINDEAWGWLALDEAYTHFGIIPMTYDPTKDLATFGAWMSGSMTGAVMSWGLRRCGTSAVIWYAADESDQGSSNAEPIYEVEDKDTPH